MMKIQKDLMLIPLNLQVLFRRISNEITSPRVYKRDHQHEGHHRHKEHTQAHSPGSPAHALDVTPREAGDGNEDQGVRATSPVGGQGGGGQAGQEGDAGAHVRVDVWNQAGVLT